MTKQEVLENLDQVKNYIKEIESVKESKKVNITIKNRWTGDIIWESEKTTYKEAVEDAIKSGADLSEADLSGADLSGADLSEADLSGADLSEADLNGCLFYMGNGNRNFKALCKAIKTIKHQDGKFEDLIK